MEETVILFGLSLFIKLDIIIWILNQIIYIQHNNLYMNHYKLCVEDNHNWITIDMASKLTYKWNTTNYKFVYNLTQLRVRILFEF